MKIKLCQVTKNYRTFYPKNISLRSVFREKPNPDGSRIWGQKGSGSRIPNPDLKHWLQKVVSQECQFQIQQVQNWIPRYWNCCDVVVTFLALIPWAWRAQQWSLPPAPGAGSPPGISPGTPQSGCRRAAPWTCWPGCSPSRWTPAHRTCSW